MESIGDRVRKLRESNDIARKDLARAAGLSYTMLSDLESGKAKTTTRLHHLAAALDVDVNYLETGKTPPKAAPSRSHPLRLDADMIAETHAALRLAYEEDGREYLIEDDPARFVRVYELRSTLSAHPTQDEWVQYGRQLQAIIAPQGAPPSGPNDGSSADGPHPKGVARRVRRKA